MTNLTKNIKKYLAEKVIDLIEMVIILFLIFYLLIKFSSSFKYAGIFILILMIVLFYLTQKYTDKYFNKWEVPELNVEEKKNYHFVDTGYSAIIVLIIFIIFYRYVNRNILIIILGVVFIIKEIIKWKRFKKELNQEIPKETIIEPNETKQEIKGEE